MDITEHITAVGLEGKQFAAAARQSNLDAEVTHCPGWTVRDLVRHLGEIHLWAAAHVAQPHDKPWVEDVSELAAFWPDLAVFWPDDSDLIDWYLETNANLVHALESAPPDVDSFTFLPAPSPLAMWARRQAHETAIHRFDAEYAAGEASSFDPVFASDGIDEMLAGFAPRKDEFPVEVPQVVAVDTSDTADTWSVTLRPDGVTTSREHSTSDLNITGAASDLYLMLWNRGRDDEIETTGDTGLLDLWHANVRVRWTT
jgi:uncharacterized protein (TIGR03083 family)